MTNCSIDCDMVGTDLFRCGTVQCIYSDRFAAAAGSVAEPHLRRSPWSETGDVGVHYAAGRKRVSGEADSAVESRFDVVCASAGRCFDLFRRTMPVIDTGFITWSAPAARQSHSVLSLFIGVPILFLTHVNECRRNFTARVRMITFAMSILLLSSVLPYFNDGEERGKPAKTAA